MTNIRNSSNSTRTIIGQQNQQQEQQEQQEQHIHEEGYNYYNNYPARARAREADAGTQLPGREAMEKIAEAYRANINPMITQAAAGIIERALMHGMEPSTVILAIEETGLASRPSPYYLSAVLRNWAENGVVLSRSRGGADVSTTEARPWWR